MPPIKTEKKQVTQLTLEPDGTVTVGFRFPQGAGGADAMAGAMGADNVIRGVAKGTEPALGSLVDITYNPSTTTVV